MLIYFIIMVMIDYIFDYRYAVRLLLLWRIVMMARGILIEPNYNCSMLFLQQYSNRSLNSYCPLRGVLIVHLGITPILYPVKCTVPSRFDTGSVKLGAVPNCF